MEKVLIAPNTYGIRWNKEELARFARPRAPIKRNDHTERNRARLLLPVSFSLDNPDCVDYQCPEVAPVSLNRGTSDNRIS